MKPVAQILSLAALVATTGCMTTPRMTLGTSSPTRSVAITHPMSEPRVTGQQVAQIRATVNGMPVTGAKCRLLAPNLSLDFFTPATVQVPVMHRPLAPARLECRFAKHRGYRTLHADRLLEMRDDDPDIPFGYVIGKAAALTSGTLDMWSYVRNGSVLTIELAPGGKP